MEGVRLPPLANIVKLFAGKVAADYKGKIDDLKSRLVDENSPVALLVCRGGVLDLEASKLQLLAHVCKELSEDSDGVSKKRLQVVLLVSSGATEELLLAALHKIPAAFGGSMTPDGDAATSSLPPNPQPPWLAIACVPTEAEMFGSLLEQREEMLLLLMEILNSSTGGLALFDAAGVGLPREGQMVLREHGAVKAWPYSEARLQELEQGPGGIRPGSLTGSSHPLGELFVFPSGCQPAHLVRKPMGDAGSGALEAAALEKVDLEEAVSSDVVAVYLGASWCDPCAPFSKKLARAARDIQESHGPKAFRVVFVTYDESESLFLADYASMPQPWLALPYKAALATKEKLTDTFGLRGIPSVVLLKGDGTLISTAGRDVISELGGEGFPFSAAQVAAAREAKMERKRQQREEATLSSLLCSPSCNFVLDKDGNQVPVSDLEARKCPVALLFTSRDSLLCTRFLEDLQRVYEELKASGKEFEVVLVPMDATEDAFQEHVRDSPWLTVPFAAGEKEASRVQDIRGLFDGVKGLPALVVLGEDGKLRTEDGVERIRSEGAKAYPFL